MRRPKKYFLPIVLVGALVAMMAGLAVTTSAQSVGTHGISFAKGCDSPLNVGDAYNCGYLLFNSIVVDTHGDTITVTALSDVVHAAGGDILSPGPAAPGHTGGNLMPALSIAAYSGGAQCFSDNPPVTPVLLNGTGSQICVLPTGSFVIFARQSFYTVVEADIAASPIDDDARITFEDLCTSGAPDCPVGPNFNEAGASAPVNTPTPTPTATPTNTPTPTPTPTNTATPTPTPTNTATPTPTPTNTPVPPTDTLTPTPTATPVPPTATPTPTPQVFQGCTAGFWKQTQHFGAYPAGLTPNTTLTAAGFVLPAGQANVTLLVALNYQGGPTVVDAGHVLIRQAVASLLNSKTIPFSLSSQQVLDQTNAALATGNRGTILALAQTLDGINNNNDKCPSS